MILVTTLSIIFIMISMIFMMLSIIFSKKGLKNRDKDTPFECGFDPMSNTRMPFSSRFFLIAVLFLVFDVEIILLLPLVIFLNFMMYPTVGMFTGCTFLIILLVGLIYEWVQGALVWAS